jgi:hypothetical protein
MKVLGRDKLVAFAQKHANSKKLWISGSMRRQEQFDSLHKILRHYIGALIFSQKIGLFLISEEIIIG